MHRKKSFKASSSGNTKQLGGPSVSKRQEKTATKQGSRASRALNQGGGES